MKETKPANFNLSKAVEKSTGFLKVNWTKGKMIVGEISTHGFGGGSKRAYLSSVPYIFIVSHILRIC